MLVALVLRQFPYASPSKFAILTGMDDRLASFDTSYPSVISK